MSCGGESVDNGVITATTSTTKNKNKSTINLLYYHSLCDDNNNNNNHSNFQDHRQCDVSKYFIVATVIIIVRFLSITCHQTADAHNFKHILEDVISFNC